MLRIAVILLGLAAISHAAVPNGYRSVCYYTNWSQYRSGKGRFYPENIDPSLCTHLMYSFGKVENANVLPYEWNDQSTEWSKGMFDRTLAMKARNPSMKVILAVGGWNMRSDPFTEFAGTQTGRQTFIHNTIRFLRDNRFDGIDMDWEYPGSRGGVPEDKENFISLIKEFHEAFEFEAKQNGRERLLLTGAFPAGRKYIEPGYDLKALHPYMDFISLMAYDFHGAWDSHTALNSPLYAHPDLDQEFNLDWAARYYVNAGVPKDKLNIGLATYGRTFTLKDPSDTKIGALVSGGGRAGQYTREAGFVSYYEACDLLASGARKYDEPVQRGRYLVKGSFWLGYEDRETLTEKACYVKQNGFGGVMFWSLDTDDFTGSSCDQGKYPLINAVLNELGSPSTQNCVGPTTGKPSNSSEIIETPGPSDKQPSKPTKFTSTPALLVTSDFDCSHMALDFYPDPNSCTSYFICVGDLALRSTCAKGLRFDPLSKQCDLEAKVTCSSA